MGGVVKRLFLKVLLHLQNTVGSLVEILRRVFVVTKTRVNLRKGSSDMWFGKSKAASSEAPASQPRRAPSSSLGQCRDAAGAILRPATCRGQSLPVDSLPSNQQS